jgi:GNAT superfamily N-acetyltransferase
MTIYIHSVTFSSDENPLYTVAAKALFKSYYEELQNDYNMAMAYQGVQEELDGLPGKFCFSKRGGLWLASYADDGDDEYCVTISPGSVLPGGMSNMTVNDFIGVIALRTLGDCNSDVGEVKRMYVNKSGRRKGIGYALSSALTSHALAQSYKSLKLDSLERLPGAVGLYEKIGFKRCSKYCSCPEDDHVCMEIVFSRGDENEATG